MVRLAGAIALVFALQSLNASALDLPKVGERKCTLTIRKLKKKKDQVVELQGYRRTDRKKAKVDLSVSWKKLDEESKTALGAIARGDRIRVVYAWSVTGRYLVRARPFGKEAEAEEDKKIAQKTVEKDDDAIDDLNAEDEAEEPDEKEENEENN